MRILSVALKNFKCHRDSCFNFEAGTNTICGENGSGKTSILEGIGWVLFDFSNYTREEMVRIGCKDAEVTITFISALDGRSYQVRRSTQRGYGLYDPQLNQRLDYELKTDVIQWIRQHLGVPPGTDLPKLFSSTIGVPQGMFTADFLLTGKDRKTVFDRILKVDEYQNTSKELLKLENYSKEKISDVTHQIELLNAQLQDWDPLVEKQAQLTTQVESLTQYLHNLQTQKQRLQSQIFTYDHQAKALVELDQALATLRQEGSLSQIRYQEAESLLAQATVAQQQIEVTQVGYQAYLQAIEEIGRLENEQKERQKLLNQQQQLLAQNQELQNQSIRLQEQLKAFDKLAQQLVELQPKVHQQSQLEVEIQQLQELYQFIQQKQQSYQLLQNQWESQQQQVQRWEEEVTKAQQAQQQCQAWDPGYQAYQEAESQLSQLQEYLQQRQHFLKQREEWIQHFHTLDLKQSSLLERKQRLDQLTQDIQCLVPKIQTQQDLESQLEKLKEQSQHCQIWRSQQEQSQAQKQHLQQQYQILSQQIKRYQEQQSYVDRIPELEEGIQTLTTQLSRIDAAQQYQSELQRIVEGGQESLTHQGHQIQQALDILDQLGRSFPTAQAHLQGIPSVLTQGSALTHRILQSLDEILTDIRRQTSRIDIQKQRENMQHELQTYYQYQAQSQQLPLLLENQLALEQQLINLTETLDTLAWNLEAEPSIIKQLNGIQSRLQELGDPRSQSQIKQREFSTYPQLEQDWQALQAQIQQQQQRIQSLNQNLQATQNLDTEIAQLQSLRQQHRSAYDQHLQALPLARLLPEHQQQLRQAQTHLTDIETHGKQQQQELEKLETNHGSLSTISTHTQTRHSQLRELGDPRFQSRKIEHELTRREQVGQALAVLGSRLEEYQQQQQILESELEKTAYIAAAMGSMQAQRNQFQAQYEVYIQHRDLATKQPEYQQRVKDFQSQIQQNQIEIEQIGRQRDPLAQSYNLSEHDSLRSQFQKAEVDIATTQTQREAIEPQLRQIRTKLEHLGSLKQELRILESHKKDREKLHKFIKFCRDAYKQAGPKITALYQSNVNVIADRLFRDIMDRPNFSLTWANDYDIWVQEDGMAPRRFISLSGGEQMAAALSVRLALLRVLGELDVAFFDEPTTNMDVQRRRRLAEAITQIKTFEQLVVISHDDTFEQVTEHTIRVEREDGIHVA